MKACTPKLPLFLFVLIAPQTVHAQYGVGDRLVVIRQAEIRVGSSVRQVLGRGQDVRVDEVNGDAIWVSHLSTGWISKYSVKTPLEAIGIFTDQINLNPLDSGAYYACAVTWSDLNEIDKALGAFNEAIRLDPQSCAYNGRGICWSKKGKTEEAIADYTEAIRLDPNNAAVPFANRARVWNVKREYVKAILDATEAIRIAPSYTSAYSIRGRAYAAAKQFDRAIVDCEKISQISAKGLSGYNDVAWFLATAPDASARDGKKAVEFATRACKLSNWSDGSILDTLAAAHAEAGHVDEAVKWEMKALEIISDGERADVKSRLGLFKSGKSFHHRANDLIVMSQDK